MNPIRNSLTPALVCLLFLLITLPTASAYYDPGVQRWVNRDPLLEEGGINLYSGIGNRAVNAVDPWGWSDVNAPPGAVSGPNPGFPNPNPILGGPGQVPPGYNPSWPTGVDSRGP